jgi:hypothetical protein
VGRALHAGATFTIKSWDEKPWLQLDGGAKLTRASVTKAYHGDISGDATLEMLMYYRADGSAGFTGLERIDGTIGARRGSFVLHAVGTYRDGVATCECSVMAGSGSGELKGLHGSGRYAATHADYPNVSFSMDYGLDDA